MTQAENFTVEIKRRIKAPRERVFDAFTIPDQILKWIGPKDCDGLSAKVDLRVGGEYRFRIDTDTHGEVAASGVFREIKRPSRLVYTWRWSDPRLDVGETLVTVDFVDVNGATDVRFRHEGLPTAEDRDGHNNGWTLSFDKLEKLFSK
jgi:glutathione S-transferase